MHHAHQRLIIHRDIKPGNILVTDRWHPEAARFRDRKDCRVRRDSGLPDTTLTSFRVLTPRYASPEQIKGEAMTIATDVYSLGVVLYELLAGRSPYQLVNGPTQEFAQEVCEREPQKPSSAVLRPQEASEGEAKTTPASFEQFRRKNSASGSAATLTTFSSWLCGKTLSPLCIGERSRRRHPATSGEHSSARTQ